MMINENVLRGKLFSLLQSGRITESEYRELVRDAENNLADVNELTKIFRELLIKYRETEEENIIARANKYQLTSEDVRKKHILLNNIISKFNTRWEEAIK
jgi:DNA recombination-dependent growth factor C